MNVLVPGEYERDAACLQHGRRDSGNTNTSEEGREGEAGGTGRLNSGP